MAYELQSHRTACDQGCCIVGIDPEITFEPEHWSNTVQPLFTIKNDDRSFQAPMNVSWDSVPEDYRPL